MQWGVYCNTKIDGGGEQSARQIAKMLRCNVYSLSSDEWKYCATPGQVWYMNDAPYKLFKPEHLNDFKRVIMAGRRAVMVLNFVGGGAHKLDWLARRITKFFFLNAEKRDGFADNCCDELKTIPKVALPPPVEIDKYLSIERDYRRQPLTIGRHSRVSLKYAPEPEKVYERLAAKLPDAEFAFQIAHGAIKKRFEKDGRFRFQHWNEQSVPDFLAGIDIYFAIISPKVHDQGPRTLIEAMAAGLPCVVEGRDGMAERITSGLDGLLIDNDDGAIAAIERLCYPKTDAAVLRGALGRAAREKATAWRPERWVEEITKED